jgi:Holliday junction resolvasome RuvABC endonuclease subunit
MFTFGQNYGGWRALLESLQIPFVEPVPRKWQTAILGAIGKGESKAKAMEYVAKRYPQLQLRKKDSGIADAICLALYAKQHI